MKTDGTDHINRQTLAQERVKTRRNHGTATKFFESTGMYIHTWRMSVHHLQATKEGLARDLVYTSPLPFALPYCICYPPLSGALSGGDELECRFVVITRRAD